MAFPTRSLADISQTVRGAIRQYLPGTDASLKQNVLYVIGKFVALLASEYELRLAWLYDHLFLTTATSEPIVRLHAAEYGVFRKPAAAASGMILGIGGASITYPAGVMFRSGAQNYVTTQPFTADALGNYNAEVRAQSVGLATNRDAGAVLTLVDAGLYSGLSITVTVAAGGIGGGADTETIDALRARALKRKSMPPQGGALPDYERFAFEVPGVVAVWARQFSNGFGRVGAWVLFSGRVHGIPTDADLAAVQAHIDLVRLVRVEFVAAAPRPNPVDLTIALSPDTVTNRTAVTAALAAFFDATAPASRVRPGLPDDPFTLPVAWLSEVISTTPGEASHTMVEPAANIVFGPGELPVLGTIDWV